MAYASETERDLRAHLYSRAIPLVTEDEMDRIVTRVKELMESGMPREEAVLAGKNLFRGSILK
jgi:hypothetical protein